MRDSTPEDYHRRILKVLVHIQSHLDEDLSLDELASISNFSPFHFHRVFRGMVGEPVKEHVRRLRLERAAHRLRFTGQPVTDLAFEAGYETHESFTRAFKTMFGESPSEFRANHRPVAYGPSPSGIHFAANGDLAGFRPPNSEGSPLSTKLEQIGPMKVAFVRHIGPYNEVGSAWQRLMSWAGMKGLFRGAPTMIGVVHDDPEVTPSEKIRYDAALVVGDGVSAENDVGIQTVEGGKYVATTHRGSYESIGNTYARLCGEWLPGSGNELLSAPSLEFYRNSPWNTKVEDLITDVYMPLAI
jgi:AraC family transcriptional regulator